MMQKVIAADSWDFGDKIATLVKRSSRGIIGDDYNVLVKRAGDEFASAIKDVRMEPGEVPVHVIAMGAGEKFGCFFAGAPVHTLTGIKPIETVAVGELVLTHRNRYRPVVQTFESDYSGVVASITCGGLPDPIISTGDHPHKVVSAAAFTSRIRYEQRQAGTFESCIDRLVAESGYVSARNVSPGDFMVIPCKPESPETVDLPDNCDPYICGLYVAEGCLVKDYRQPTRPYSKLLFVFGDGDAAMIDYLQKWHPVAAQPSRTSEHSCRCEITDRPVATAADKLFGHTSHTKHIHPAVFAWNAEDRLRFLAGYFDGDGHAVVRSNHARYVGTLTASTVSKTLALDIQRLCATVGVSASIARCHNYERNRGKYAGFGRGRGDLPIFHINIGARDSNKLLQHCLRLARHDRTAKYGGSSVMTSGTYILVPVRTVELSEVDAIVRYNLEVADDNTFVTDICTHNSNRNGDFFSEPALLKYHDTFRKFAKAYRHHANKDPKVSYGVVKASAYNKDMGRVELLLGLNGTKEAAERNEGLVADKELEKLASDSDIAVSMACGSDPDYPVLTRDRGYVGIADIQVGDYVWTHKARWRRVCQLIRRQYSGELITLRVNGMPMPLELTAEHPLLAKVFSGSRGVEAVQYKARRYFADPDAFDNEPADWYPASAISLGDRLFYAPITRYDGYGAIDDVRLAAIMGYYLAEGSFGFNGERACCTSFACAMSDSLPRRLPALVEALYPDVTVKIVPHAVSPCGLSVQLYSTEFSEFLRTYVGRGAKHKMIPPEIFNATREVKLAFLGAWLDGDGWIDKKGAHWSTASAGLVLNGRDLLISLGISSSIYRLVHTSDLPRGQKRNGVGIEYTLNIAHIDLPALVATSQKAAEYPIPTQHTRGKPSCMRPCVDGTYAYRVSTITSRIGENVPVYNFSVEEDETYSIGGFVSHNCTVPFDVCSSCGNKAKSRAEYCEEDTCPHGGCKHNLGKVAEDGHVLYVDNPDPKFFDISSVFRPADRIAYGNRADYMQKAASHQVIGGAEWAEIYGITPPIQLLLENTANSYDQRTVKLAYQLAAIEDEIEQTNPRWAHDLALAFALPTSPVDFAQVNMFKTAEVANALWDSQEIMLSPRDFVSLVAGGASEKTAALSAEVSGLLPGIYNRLISAGDLVGQASLFGKAASRGLAPVTLRRFAENYASTHSVKSGSLSRRLWMSAINNMSAPTLLQRQAEKRASAIGPAEELARRYALYKLACLSTINDSDLLALTCKAAIVQNYINC